MLLSDPNIHLLMSHDCVKFYVCVHQYYYFNNTIFFFCTKLPALSR